MQSGIDQVQTNTDNRTFANKAPLLIISEPSVRQVNEWLRCEARNSKRTVNSITSAVFRANLILDGRSQHDAMSFFEDAWKSICIANMHFQVRFPRSNSRWNFRLGDRTLSTVYHDLCGPMYRVERKRAFFDTVTTP